MPTIRYFTDDDTSIPVADYIAALDSAGRGKDAARMLDAIDLLAEIGMAGAAQMGTRFSRLIDRALRIWELRPGGHRIAYVPDGREIVLLHAWKKGRQALDPKALRRAQHNLERYRR